MNSVIYSNFEEKKKYNLKSFVLVPFGTTFSITEIMDFYENHPYNVE